MKTIRSFLAVNISVETARLIADDQKILRDRCREAGLEVRWVPPQNMHITLRFLGEITEPMIKALQDNLEDATRSIAPFEMVASGLGVFPDTGEPRVLWAGVTSRDDQLEHLYREVSKILEDTGFRNDDKPFKSHVTLGRVKSAPAGVAGCLEEMDVKEYGTTVVRDLVCYRSDLTHQGADYHLLWKLPLKGRPSREAASQQIDEQPINEEMNADPQGEAQGANEK